MSNFDKSLEKIKPIFKFSGITYKSKKIKTGEKIKIRCVYLFNFICLNSDLLGAIYCFVDGVRTGKTFVELTYIAPCVTFSCLCNLKAIFLIHYEDQVCDLIDNLYNLDNKRTKNDSDIKKGETNFLHRILKASNILNVMLVLTFMISPFIVIAIKYVKTYKVELILPFLIKYPFDPYDMRYWPFVYIHQFWSSTYLLVLLHFSIYKKLVFLTNIILN